MSDVEERLNECIDMMEDNAEKTSEMLEAYQSEKRANEEKDKTIKTLMGVIKWLVIIIIVGTIISGIVRGIFVYGYMYSPYLYGEITQEAGESSGNQVQIVGG